MNEINLDGFSKEWENIYDQNIHMSIWPWSDVVSLVSKYCNPVEKYNNILEIGCGAGANIPFFINRKNHFYGLDGSETIINQLKDKFPELRQNLVAGDFTKSIPFDLKFDAVVDRGSLTHNSTASIKECLTVLKDKMNQKSFYFGVDLFSTEHSSFKLGEKVDEFTRKNINTKQFKGVGNVHFFSKDHIYELFEANSFKILELEHVVKESIQTSTEPYRHCVYNLVAQA